MSTSNASDALNEIKTTLEKYPSLFDAFEHVEPAILKLFNVERVSIFQRRRQ
jgi:hypothetical protein